MIEIYIDGVRTLVKDIELVGEPHFRDGKVIQEVKVTLFEPLHYFAVALNLDEGHDGSEI